jgi:hypothetical protein
VRRIAWPESLGRRRRMRLERRRTHRPIGETG